MPKFKKSSMMIALAVGELISLHEVSLSQTLNGTYSAALSCAKLPFTDAPLDNEPVDLKISDSKAVYSRTLYGPNRKAIVGKETGTGSVASDGTIILTGGWRGRSDSLKASYHGKLTSGGTTLTGTHVIEYQGHTFHRTCALTLRKG